MLGRGSAGSGTVTVVPLEPPLEGWVLVVVDVEVVVVVFEPTVDVERTEPDGTETGRLGTPDRPEDDPPRDGTGSDGRGVEPEPVPATAAMMPLSTGSSTPDVEPGRVPRLPDPSEPSEPNGTSRAEADARARPGPEDRTEPQLVENRGRQPRGGQGADRQQRAEVRECAHHIGHDTVEAGQQLLDGTGRARAARTHAGAAQSGEVAQHAGLVQTARASEPELVSHCRGSVPWASPPESDENDATSSAVTSPCDAAPNA